MEVHAHSHTPRKKWTHYLWEFLMLFLAVSLGFFVENQREHIVEHKRAKVYAASLYDELKKDTARLNALIIEHNFISGKLDTFCKLIKKAIPGNVSNGMIYYYASYATHVSFFSPFCATIEQLKGSGNLRIMSNKTAHAISEYDEKISELEKEYSLSKSEFEKIEDLHFRLFDIYYMETLLTDKRKRDSLFMLDSLPIRNDPEMMKEYTGWMKFESNIYLFQIKDFLNPIRKKAESLLELLKEEYHLK